MTDSKRPLKKSASKGKASSSTRGSSSTKNSTADEPEFRGMSWQTLLKVVRGGGYKQSFGNVLVILTHHPMWKDVFAYDEFVGDIVTTRAVKWPSAFAPSEKPVEGEWTAQDTGRLRGWLDQEYSIDLATGTLGEVLRVVAEKRRSHAVRDYLKGLKWDKKKRLDSWLVRLAGAEDSAYTRAVGSKFLIGAVARVMKPGCKLDTMVVFEGEQGLKKSTMLEVLFHSERGWYSGTPFKMGTKDGYQTLRRKWGLEIPELSHFDRAEMNDIKAFLSTPSDNYRASYGVKNIDFPRQSICVGTTNDSEWHKDNTGGRRFLPIFLVGVDIGGSKKRVDLKTLDEERDQLWAEAVARYTAGEIWWLEDDLATAAAEQIERRRQPDPWEDRVRDWLEKRIVKFGKYGVSTAEILDALDKPLLDRTKGDEMRVGTLLRLAGWERRDTRGQITRYKYFPKDASRPSAEIVDFAKEVGRRGNPDRKTAEIPHSPPAHPVPRRMTEEGGTGVRKAPQKP